MRELTENELKALNDEDRGRALQALHDIRVFATDEKRDIYSELVSYFKRGGLFLYKPACLSWEQALMTRMEQMCTLDAILCDYDGCGTPEQLKELVKEAQTTVCNCIICFPSSVWAGSGLGKEMALSEYEQKHGFQAYDVGFDTELSKNPLARIPYELYAVPDGMEDKHGFVLDFRETQQQIADHWWHVCDYKNAMASFSGNREFGADDCETALAADGRCTFTYGGYGNAGDVPNGVQTKTDYDGLDSREREFYEFNEIALDAFANMLRICNELANVENDEPEFWKTKIDDIIKYAPATFWEKVRDLHARNDR